MSALTADRRLREERWTRRAFKLPNGKTAYRGGIAVYDQSAGKCIPAETGSGQTDLFILGTFAEQVANASGGDLDVVVQLKREIRVIWFANDGANPVLATDLGKSVFSVDDQTVSISSASSTRSAAGTAWAIDATLGVAVEMSDAGSAEGRLASDETRLTALETALPDGAALSFTANDAAPATVVHNAVYTIPATGAASTVTLPAAAANGTAIRIIADGTNNAHTVQYRDATGPTNLSTALTASKRHFVLAVKKGSAWYVNAYVSP